MHVLYESADHKNILFDEFSTGTMVQSNQHVLVDGGEAMILDPGGHKIHTRLFAEMSSVVPMSKLKYIFFSHQDPDIIAATNAWLMMTDAKAFLSGLWMRFITHFGVDDLVVDRIQAIPDQGMRVRLGATELLFIPAHFLHSPGNFQVYDPASKILYTGDLGASLGCDYRTVADFDAHIPKMEGFHRRYMSQNKVFRLWAAMVKGLDIETIAPQHGAMIQGKEMVQRFITWLERLPCGLDEMEGIYKLPA